MVARLALAGYGPAMPTEGMSIAVTGPTGTFGVSLMPLLQADSRISRIIGIARRPFDPAEHGWTKMHYIRGDVRDPDSRDQRRRNPERLPGRRFGWCDAVRLRLLLGGVRVSRRQPLGDDGGVAGTARRQSVLRAGEGGDRGPAARGAGGAPRTPRLRPASTGSSRPQRGGREERAARP